MRNKTITREEIAKTIVLETGITGVQAHEILREIILLMTKTLAEGESLKLSSFGTFRILKKKERIGRNPKTLEEVMITPRNSLSFRAGGVLMDKILEYNRLIGK